MQKSYTKQAEEVLRTARKLAKQMGHPYVGTAHLLVALRQVYTGVAGQVLAANGIEEGEILKVVSELVSPVGENGQNEKPEESPRLSYILDNSAGHAVKLRAEKIGTEHMLLAILLDTECVAVRILTTLNVNLQKLTGDIFEVADADPELLKEIQEGQGHAEIIDQ